MISIVFVCALLTLTGEAQAFPVGRLRAIPVTLNGTVVKGYVIKDYRWPYNIQTEDSVVKPENVLRKAPTDADKMNDFFWKLLKGTYFLH